MFTYVTKMKVEANPAAVAHCTQYCNMSIGFKLSECVLRKTSVPSYITDPYCLKKMMLHDHESGDQMNTIHRKSSIY